MKLHSMSSVITNSSETIYTSLTNIKGVKDFLSTILQAVLPDNTFTDIDDYFEFKEEFAESESLKEHLSGYFMPDPSDEQINECFDNLENKLRSSEPFSSEEKSMLYYDSNDSFTWPTTCKISSKKNTSMFNIDFLRAIEELVNIEAWRDG